MSEHELSEIVAQLRSASTPQEAEVRLRRLLAEEVERCASMLVVGELCEIHSSMIERADQYRVR